MIGCWGNAEVGWRRPAVRLAFHSLAFSSVAPVGLSAEVWCERWPGPMALAGYKAVDAMLDESRGERLAPVAASLVDEHM